MPDLECYYCRSRITPSSDICRNCHRPLLFRNQYRIQDIVYQHENSTIYKALHENLGITLAVKQVDASLAKRLRHEADILQHCRHRLNFIPHLYDFWQNDKHAFLVMEFVEGRTLDLVHPLAWPAPQVEVFLRKLLEYLVALHNVGVIHRDLKPRNIMLTEDDNYVLIDFNAAKFVNSPTVFSGHTPGYAPPEQDRATRRRYEAERSLTNERSDLYSLGATAYQLLTRSIPDRPVRPPSQIVRNVPAVLERTLLWMLQPIPSQRPENAQMALEQLNHPDRLSIPVIIDPLPTELDVNTDQTMDPFSQSTVSSTYGSERQRRGKGRISGVAWSADGGQLAVASALGVYVYEVPTWGQQLFIPASSPIQHVALFPQRKVLAFALPHMVQVWQIQPQQSPQPFKDIPISSGDLTAFAHAARGTILAGACGHELVVWQADDGKPIATISEEIGTGGLAINADGTLLAAVTRSGVKVWEVRQGGLQLIWTVKPPAQTAGIALQGRTLVAASKTTARVWQVGVETPLCTIEQPDEPILSVALAPEGKLLATASQRAILLWQVRPCVPNPILKESIDGLHSLSFDPSGTFLAGVSHAGVWLLRMRDYALRHVLPDHFDSIHSVTFSPDGELLAAIGGQVRIWQVDDIGLQPKHTLHALSDKANGVVFDPAGARLVSASQEGIRLWNAVKGALLRSLPTQAAQAHSIVFADDGATLLNVAPGAVERWQLDRDEPERILEQHLGRRYDVVLAAGGQLLATFADRSIHIWRSDGTPYATLDVTIDINSVAFAPDGQCLVVASDDRTQILQITPQLRLAQRSTGAHRVVFAPDGETVALLHEKEITLWRWRTDAVMTLGGHTDIVNDVAFNPSKQLMASASEDGTVRLWGWDSETRIQQDNRAKPESIIAVSLNKSISTPSHARVITSQPTVHLMSPNHPSETATNESRQHTLILKHPEVVRQSEEHIIEELILHRDYERLWGSIAYEHGKRYLLTGYGPFGGTSLVRCALEKAHDELLRSGQDEGILLAFHFQVEEETTKGFKIEADTFSLGRMKVQDNLSHTSSWKALKAYAVYQESSTVSVPFHFVLDNPLKATFLNTPEKANESDRPETKNYNFSQFVTELSDFFEQGKDNSELQQIILRIVGSEVLSSRIVIIIDKIKYLETLETLSRSKIFSNRQIIGLVVGRKEYFDRWLNAHQRLRVIGFKEWYIPCLWKIDLNSSLFKSEDNLHLDERRKLFEKHLEYLGRGSFGHIIAELKHSKNISHGKDTSFIDPVNLTDRSEIQHNAWMQDVLDNNWATILGDHFGGKYQDEREDRARIGIYYLLDWIASQNRHFSKAEIIEEALKIPITIADDPYITSETIQKLLYVLTRNTYLELKDDKYRVIWNKNRLPKRRIVRRQQKASKRNSQNSELQPQPNPHIEKIDSPDIPINTISDPKPQPAPYSGQPMNSTKMDNLSNPSYIPLKQNYLDFDLTIGLQQGSTPGYPITLQAPAGGAQGMLLLSIKDLQFNNYMKDVQIAPLSSTTKTHRSFASYRQSVQDFGCTLFEKLFADDVRNLYDLSVQLAQQQNRGLRLKLHIQPPELISLPWEFLYDPRGGEFVCLSCIATDHGGAASANRSPDQNLLIQLHRFFSTGFSKDGLRTVCFELGIDYDNLVGAGKTGKARELVAYCERNGRTAELIAVARRLRPGVSWDNTVDEHKPSERLPHITSITRYLDMQQPPQSLTVKPPLQILGLVASPQDLPPLEILPEQKRLEEAVKDLQERGLLKLTWLNGQTWHDLQQALLSGPWHIFHFMGHVRFDPNTGEGFIALSDDDGFAHHVNAMELGRLLANHSTLRLTLLNACEGARSNQHDIFSGIAATLIRRGIPAVLTVQDEISDFAVQFARAFYKTLAEGLPVDAAVAEARKCMSVAIPNSVEWGTPMLYMGSPDGILFDLQSQMNTVYLQ